MENVAETLSSLPIANKHIAIPTFLDKPPTGILHYDLVPIISMLACMPTLLLFARRKRYADFALYSTGFVVAVIYHSLHMCADQGLASTYFWGISGAAWRTMDILGANLILARTMGHALGVDHPMIALIPNVGLPVMLVVLLLKLPSMGIDKVSRVTAGTCVVTMAAQLAMDGGAMLRHTVSKYTRRGMMRAAASIVAGLFSFAMPQLQPESYWLWHSLWHVFMGVGYYELYVQIEGIKAASKADPAAKEGAAVPPARRGRSSASKAPTAIGGVVANGTSANGTSGLAKRGRSRGRSASRKGGRSKSRARSSSRADNAATGAKGGAAGLAKKASGSKAASSSAAVHAEATSPGRSKSPVRPRRARPPQI